MSGYYANNIVVTSGTTCNFDSDSFIVFNGEGLSQLSAQTKTKPETEVEWLKRRVDELCWREAK